MKILLLIPFIDITNDRLDVWSGFVEAKSLADAEVMARRLERNRAEVLHLILKEHRDGSGLSTYGEQICELGVIPGRISCLTLDQLASKKVVPGKQLRPHRGELPGEDPSPVSEYFKPWIDSTVGPPTPFEPPPPFVPKQG